MSALSYSVTESYWLPLVLRQPFILPYRCWRHLALCFWVLLQHNSETGDQRAHCIDLLTCICACGDVHEIFVQVVDLIADRDGPTMGVFGADIQVSVHVLKRPNRGAKLVIVIDPITLIHTRPHVFTKHDDLPMPPMFWQCRKRCPCRH